jgi:hypothetical protein
VKNPPNEKPNEIRPDHHPSATLPDGSGVDIFSKPIYSLKNLSISTTTACELSISRLSSACKV